MGGAGEAEGNEMQYKTVRAGKAQLSLGCSCPNVG